MAKKYKNEGLMKFLTVIGGLVGLASQIFALFNFQWILGRMGLCDDGKSRQNGKTLVSKYTEYRVCVTVRGID